MRFSAKVLTNKWAFSIPDWNSLASTSTKSSTPPAPHLLERGVLHDDKRAFTKNRKPGRCCDNDARRPGSR
jgi:hypothetical protein